MVLHRVQKGASSRWPLPELRVLRAERRLQVASHKSLSELLPDKGILKKSHINVTFRLACVALWDTPRVGEDFMSFILGTGLRDMKTRPSPHWILSHFAVLHLRGCYYILWGWGQSHLPHSVPGLGPSWNKSQKHETLLWGEESLDGARPGFSLQSCLWAYRWRKKLFSSVFVSRISILFHPISHSIARLRIRPALCSPNTWWHTWHKSGFLCESWGAFWITSFLFADTLGVCCFSFCPFFICLISFLYAAPVTFCSGLQQLNNNLGWWIMD